MLIKYYIFIRLKFIVNFFFRLVRAKNYFFYDKIILNITFFYNA